jgi:hypothetical protein
LLIVFGLGLGMFTIGEIVEAVQASGPPRDLLADVCSRIQTVSGNLCLFLILGVGIEFRKQACLTFFHFVRWEEIQSAEWKLSWQDYVLLTLKLPDNPVGLFKAIPRARKESVDRILMEHGVKAELDEAPAEHGRPTDQGAPADEASPSRTPGQREPADRIGGPALLLMCSAILQIGVAAPVVGLLIFVGLGSEQPWVISAIAVLAGVISVAPAIVVFAGALKMRRLIDYRFCRRSAIVAMLPLGAGFLLGLPFGIWALLVLRRPDVQAAFAGGRE